MSLIKDRFDQRDYNVYMNCEQLILEATGGDAYKDKFQTVTSLYGSHHDQRELEAHLSTFTHNIPRVDFLRESKYRLGIFGKCVSFDLANVQATVREKSTQTKVSFLIFIQWNLIIKVALGTAPK